MDKLIFICIITAAMYFSACSGSNELLHDKNKSQEPNNTDNQQLKHPQNDSLKIPKPADIPFEEENHDIKWI